MTTNRVGLRRAVPAGAGWAAATCAGAIVALLSIPAGCARIPGMAEAGARPAAARPESPLARAEELYRGGNYEAALIECVDVAHKDPLTPGLAQLRYRIMNELNRRRDADARMRSSQATPRMLTDAEKAKAIPDTYGARQFVKGETSTLRSPLGAMQQVIERKITLHLDNVNLSTFILALGESENINIIADTMDDTKTMTVHADKVPLREILDYVSRNMGVSFLLGENIIWAAAKATTTGSTTPLETRIYRLRKGIPAITADAELDEEIPLKKAIQEMVERDANGKLIFDRNAHVLLVKDTRENLAKIEDIIDVMDVSPPQVLISARFIGVAVKDMRELGIDWELQSPITVTKKAVLKDGQPALVPETVLAAGETVKFPEFSNSGNGMNLTYRGVLTDPMFKAVLHALQLSGKTRVLSSPKVTTLNNNTAHIRVGTDFLYPEEYQIIRVFVGYDENGNAMYEERAVPSGPPTKEQLGITLDVTPSVGADLRSITLALKPEIAQFDHFEMYETVGGTGGAANNNLNTGSTVTNSSSIMVKYPIFKRNEITTKAVVQSGETVVMGGLVTTTESKNESKVPFLGSLPLIGYLFKHETIDETQENLLIFVTAAIISERGEDLVPLDRTLPRQGPEGAGALDAAPAAE